MKLNAARKPEPQALTLMELLVVGAVLTILTLLLLPTLTRGPHPPKLRPYCLNNLKQVGISFMLWAEDNGDKFPMQVSARQGGTAELIPRGMAYVHFQVLSNYLRTPKLLVCNLDKERTAATRFTEFNNMNLSYFICTSATSSTNRQAERLLAGDSDITVDGKLPLRRMVALATNHTAGWSGHRHTVKGHPPGGNLLFCDSHVEFVPSDRLQSQIRRSGPTHTLAIP